MKKQDEYVKEEKYNQYSMATIKRLIAEGAEASNKYKSLDELIYNSNYSLSEWEFVAMGFENPSFTPGEIKEYYRIGEPIIDYERRAYRSSYNFADAHPEDGVSVVTTGWLNSFKSVFFGTSDDDIRKKGIYKIKGFEIPCRGGDDEPLICPIDWAAKTKIRTRAGLEKAVKKRRYKDE